MYVYTTTITTITNNDNLHRSLVRRDNSTQIIDSLNEELNETLSALRETSEILEIISRRNFTAEEAELQEYQTITQSALALSTLLWTSAIDTNNQV